MAEQPAPRWRLFFALWPPDPVRRRLRDVVSRLQGQVEGRWVRPENLHVTLAFLGSVNGEGRACAERAAERINAPSFDLSMDCVEHWRRQQVLWLGATRLAPALSQLAERLRLGLADCPVAHEDRPYRCHLTLARRVRRPPTDLVIEPIDWHIDRFVLVSSDTSSTGSEYTVLRSWSLG